MFTFLKWKDIWKLALNTRKYWWERGRGREEGTWSREKDPWQGSVLWSIHDLDTLPEAQETGHNEIYDTTSHSQSCPAIFPGAFSLLPLHKCHKIRQWTSYFDFTFLQLKKCSQPQGGALPEKQPTPVPNRKTHNYNLFKLPTNCSIFLF